MFHLTFSDIERTIVWVMSLKAEERVKNNMDRERREEREIK
jgi:hypothetical protein